MRLPAPDQGYQKLHFAAAAASAALCIAALVGLSSARASTNIQGIWLDHTKRGAVELYNCGRSLCGRVIWMKNPIKPSGEPFRDKRNSDPSMHNRTICGMQMIGDLRQHGARTWDGGWIYDPERGKKFSLKVTRRGDDRLTITGYLLSPAFGKSFGWTRAPKEVGRCAPAVKAATG